MKLKKIASLMLAGIMAVSMLTACDTTSNTPDTGDDDQGTTTPVTGYSAKLGDEIAKLSTIAGKKVDWSESSKLQSSLNYQVGNVGYHALTGSFLNSLNDGQVQFVDSGWTTPAIVTTVNDTVNDDMGAEQNARNYRDTDFAIMAINPTLTNYATDDYNTVMLFVVDNGVDLNNAMDRIAEMVSEAIVELDDDFTSSTLGSMNADYEYTGSVATCTKTFEAGHGVGVSFIAVEIDRHIV